MEVLLLLAAVCALMFQVQALCIILPEEHECAKKLNISKDDIYNIYRQDHPLRARFAFCVWTKLGYQETDGLIVVIDYEKIKNNRGALSIIARICDDAFVRGEPHYYGKLLSAAVEACKNCSCSNYNFIEQITEDKRKCIEEHVKQNDKYQ